VDRSVTPLQGAVLFGAVLVVVTVVGAAVLTDDTTRSPPSPDGVAEQYRSLDGVQATQVQTVTTGNETTRTVRRVSFRPGAGQYRVGAVRSENRSVAYDLIVSNGSARWLYDRENRTVQRNTVEGRTTSYVTSATRLERYVAAAVNDTEETEVPRLPSVSPLGPRQAGSAVNGSDVRATVEYVGTDRIDGRPTYVLSVSFDRSSGRDGSARLWLDTEWFMPLQRQSSVTVDGERFETRVRYRNVSFEPGLDDSLFEFDPPENVTVDTGVRLRSFESRAALSRNTTLPVPDPAVPDGFALEEASLTTAETTGVTLRYTNETARLSVTVTNEPGNFADEGTPVTVANTTARLNSIGQASFLSWSCRDRSVLVGGSVSNATLLQVAESVGCGRSGSDAQGSRSDSPDGSPASVGDRQPVTRDRSRPVRSAATVPDVRT